MNGICLRWNNMLWKSIRDQANEIETAWVIKLESVRQIFNLMCRWIWALSIRYAQNETGAQSAEQGHTWSHTGSSRWLLSPHGHRF